MNVAMVEISQDELQDWLDAHTDATIVSAFQAGSYICIIYK